MDVTSSVPGSSRTPARAAIRSVILLGFVSLFGDMTYEGARSIVGPYLALLGASATVVGVAAGFGELAGYAFRLCQVSSATGRDGIGLSRLSATSSTFSPFRCSP